MIVDAVEYVSLLKLSKTTPHISPEKKIINKRRKEIWDKYKKINGVVKDKFLQITKDKNLDLHVVFDKVQDVQHDLVVENEFHFYKWDSFKCTWQKCDE